MNTGEDPTSDLGENDPYLILGIAPEATFEDVQKAKEKKLLEVDQDLIAKAKIEAAYDALLMNSLKARQMGQASEEALVASNKEIGGSILTRLKTLANSADKDSNNGFLPQMELPIGQGLILRISLGLLAIVLALISKNQTIEIILALSTIGLFISQISRGRKPLPSIGWSVLLLSIGLILGGILFGPNSVEQSFINSISRESLEAIPSIILLWLGALFLA